MDNIVKSRLGFCFCVLSLLLLANSACMADPCPGDVFREYKWRPDTNWQRVTGPKAKAAGAKKFLPNAINKVNIDDLDRVVKAEVYIEMLLCHSGTVGQKIRVNKKAWLPIPESAYIPGDAGTGGPNTEYQYMRYPAVKVRLDSLRKGDNTFEFTCSGGTVLGKWWPQWIVYGVTFRIYYNDSKPHPEGAVINPAAGSVIGELPSLEASASGSAGVKQVDFIGFYEDYNWEGDGNFGQWHYRYLYGEVKNHIGTATSRPYKVVWDNSWVPTQPGPIKIMARIVDKTGMCYMTEAVDNISFARRKTVRMYKPYQVPRSWATRAGDIDSCKVDVTDDLSKAIDAKIVMATWNGLGARVIGINGIKVVNNVGKDHDLSYDEFAVPLNLIKSGVNTCFTYSNTRHHGIEVMWPGMVLMVKYNEPES